MNADDRAVSLSAFDFETHQFRPGLQAPPIVCASSASFVDGKIVGELLWPAEAATNRLEQLLSDGGLTTAFANAPFDLAVAASFRPHLLPLIFRALREGRIHDILMAQSLDQIFHGTLGVDPRSGGDLRSPSTGKVTKRYSLEIVHYLLTNKVDAKSNDVWRKSYALLQDIHPSRWPEMARQYPVDDGCNTLEDAAIQIFGKAGPHSWVSQPAIPGILSERVVCKHCNGELTETWPPSDARCEKLPRQPHRNLENLPEQVEAAFAAWLGACHSLRTDSAKIATCESLSEAKAKVYVERFKKKGWIRGVGVKGKEEGSEDVVAVKKAVARAYGAIGKCLRCAGTGMMQTYKTAQCRGAKERGRYQGCVGAQCAVCQGKLTVTQLGSVVTCKNVFDEKALEAGRNVQEALIEAGCDGTGLDFTTVPLLPRSDKYGVKMNRDTLMESGDDDLFDYGFDEFRKSLQTYIPYLKTGITAPLNYSPNVIVASGRYSYEGSPIHQMPRKGKERECIRARGAWCGYPTEMILGMTDYEAGELSTLSQYCYWVLGYSKMRDAINASGKPGILHSDLASEVLGVPLPEFLDRLKNKDKQAKDFRQMTKCINFGVPGGMGVPKLVMTSRQKNAGFTVTDDGPSLSEDGERGFWGVRFCVLTGGNSCCGETKRSKWKGRDIVPTCDKCIQVVNDILMPAYHRRYPEIRDYFKWVDRCLEQNENRIPSLVWDSREGKPRIERWRGSDSQNFRSGALNNGFQSMLAAVMKDAYCTITRECYLGVTSDGKVSPLAGCRAPLVVHDEPVTELIRLTAHMSGPRVAEIMMASGYKIAPDVAWRAETAISEYLHKAAEPVYDLVTKFLVPWEPAIKKAA